MNKLTNLTPRLHLPPHRNLRPLPPGMQYIMPDRCTVLVKKELLYAGLFGLAAWLCGIVFIDRLDRNKARNTMDRVSSILHDNNVGIAPLLRYFFHSLFSFISLIFFTFFIHISLRPLSTLVHFHSFISTLVHFHTCSFPHLFISTLVHFHSCSFPHLFISTLVHFHTCSFPLHINSSFHYSIVLVLCSAHFILYI